MRFIHLSDLHIGKKVNEFSMLEDQQWVLTHILEIIDQNKIQGVFIAGDLYDKAVPSSDAVALMDHFLTKLVERSLYVFIIAGNHDSQERISFASQVLKSSKVFIAGSYKGTIEKVKVEDEYGPLTISMLPFLRPVQIRKYFPELEIETYQDGMKAVIEQDEFDLTQRNILMLHQFVTGAQTCESEELSVGGIDQIDGNLFGAYDYVALGHIHKPQKILRETMRYCGTPLKYSFSEASHEKSLVIVDILEKTNVKVQLIPLQCLRDLREIKGTYMELTNRSYYEHTNIMDYLHITLTDEEDILDAVSRLRGIYPNIMKLDYDNQRTRSGQTMEDLAATLDKTPFELFKEFYVTQNGQEMSPEQEDIILQLLEEGDRIK